jgi:para-nitrobenzyl esterase
VHSHMASAGSAGLFHKAIIMSGAYALGAGAQSGLAASEAAGSTLANSALTLAGQSCPAPVTADCLRTSIPVAALLATQNSVWPSGPVPTVDGTVLTQPVRDHLIAGTYSQVPVIQGTTRDEWRLFVALDEVTPATVAKPYLGAALTTTNLPDAITGTFPFLAGQAATLAATAYNPALFGNSASVAMGALGTDLLFTCNARLSSRLQKNNASVYVYEFNDSTTPALFPGISFPMGAAHTSELNYLFNVAGRPALTTPQQAVSDSMVSAWSRFAATGNPNPAATHTAWPALGASESVLSFDAVGTTLIPDATFTATHRCSTVWTPGV